MIVVHNAQFHFLDAKTAVTVYSSSSLIPQTSPNQYAPAATTSTVDVFAATTSSFSHPRLFHEGLTVVGLVQIVSPTSADVFHEQSQHTEFNSVQILSASRCSVSPPPCILSSSMRIHHLRRKYQRLIYLLPQHLRQEVTYLCTR